MLPVGFRPPSHRRHGGRARGGPPLTPKSNDEAASCRSARSTSPSPVRSRSVSVSRSTGIGVERAGGRRVVVAEQRLAHLVDQEADALERRVVLGHEVGAAERAAVVGDRASSTSSAAASASRRPRRRRRSRRRSRRRRCRRCRTCRPRWSSPYSRCRRRRVVGRVVGPGRVSSVRRGAIVRGRRSCRRRSRCRRTGRRSTRSSPGSAVSPRPSASEPWGPVAGASSSSSPACAPSCGSRRAPCRRG